MHKTRGHTMAFAVAAEMAVFASDTKKTAKTVDIIGTAANTAADIDVV